VRTDAETARARCASPARARRVHRYALAGDTPATSGTTTEDWDVGTATRRLGRPEATAARRVVEALGEPAPPLPRGPVVPVRGRRVLPGRRGPVEPAALRLPGHPGPAGRQPRQGEDRLDDRLDGRRVGGQPVPHLRAAR